MAWQRYVADVAGEVNPDGSYHYQVVVVTVPRQSGKTTLMRAVGVDRCVARPGCGVFYTAQTGKDARARWRDLVDQVMEGPLAPLVIVRNSAGSERLEFPNRSALRVFAPNPKSLHGYTPPLVMLDEAFAHDETTGDLLMGAIGPAQVTIPHRQLWIVSTAGTAESGFLRKWVDAGRAGAPGVAYFEWSAPDGADVYDPQVWPTYHPAMESGLVTADAIAAEASRLSRAEFERAYANRWTRTASHLIAWETWDRLGVGREGRPGVQLLPATGVVFGFDVMHDRSAAAVVAAWRDDSGVHAKVVQSGPGMAWVEDTVRGLRAEGWSDFTTSDDGPGREVADLLDRHPGRVPVRLLGSREVVDSWGFLMQHLIHGTLTHDGTDALAVAAANVATRPSADGARPSRRHSAGDVSPLLALEWAAYVLDHQEDRGGLEYTFGGD
jgi:phage terminase large subunit-like protein